MEEHEFGALPEDVVVWVEEAMSRTRRPYGIDQMAVGLACAPAGGEAFATVSLGVFRPADYYADDGTREQNERFVRALLLDQINGEPEGVRLAAALFSGGAGAGDGVSGLIGSPPPAWFAAATGPSPRSSCG